MTTFAPLTTPAVYFINTTTMIPKWVFQTTGNANGIAYGPDSTLYVDVTDISSGRPNVKDPLKAHRLLGYDTHHGKPQLRSERLFSNSISYYCDGVRVSRSGLVFCAAADGVDVIEPKSGATLGRIRTGGGSYLAVNIAFEDHTMDRVESEWNKGAVDEEVVEACEKNPLLFAQLLTFYDTFNGMAFVFNRRYTNTCSRSKWCSNYGE